MKINVGYVLVPDAAVGLPSAAPLRGILMFSKLDFHYHSLLCQVSGTAGKSSYFLCACDFNVDGLINLPTIRFLDLTYL